MCMQDLLRIKCRMDLRGQKCGVDQKWCGGEWCGTQAHVEMPKYHWQNCKLLKLLRIFRWM